MVVGHGLDRPALSTVGSVLGAFLPTLLLFPLIGTSRTILLFGLLILLVALVGPFVPVPLMALDLLIGLLQAYIFTVLSVVYVGAALRRGEE